MKVNTEQWKTEIKRKYQKFYPVSKFFELTKLRPSFFIIGFQKSGTTTLYNDLTLLDNFAQAERKEIDILTEPDCTLSQFLYYFPNWSPSQFTCNASHQTAFLPEGLSNMLRFFPPPTKLVAIMRNPVDRAFSHFNYDKQIGLLDVPLSFEEYVEMEMNILSKIDLSDAEEIANNTQFYSRYGMCISRGLYYPFLQRFMDAGYPIHCIFLENYKRQPEREFASLLSYLNIETDQELELGTVVNKGHSKARLKPETRQQLAEFYAPHNQKLFELIEERIQWS